MRDDILGTRVLIVAFSGWNDAGDAASNAVAALRDLLEVDPVAAVDPEDYFDYQFNRPTVRTDEDGARRIEWPGVTIFGPRDPLGDVYLMLGTQPSRNRKTFAAELPETIEDREPRTGRFLGPRPAGGP